MFNRRAISIWRIQLPHGTNVILFVFAVHNSLVIITASETCSSIASFLNWPVTDIKNCGIHKLCLSFLSPEPHKNNPHRSFLVQATDPHFPQLTCLSTQLGSSTTSLTVSTTPLVHE